jgi:prophage maintenance system killer protein
MKLFESLGFCWDRAVLPGDVPVHSIERVCFRFNRMLPEFVWDASVLEGNSFSYTEVQTILDGITVGGHRISDQEQILNLARCSKHLFNIVKSKAFALNKETFCQFHSIFAKNEVLEWGHFRGEGDEINHTPHVALGLHGKHVPLSTIKDATNLNKMFDRGIHVLNLHVASQFEKALAFFLFGALQQFFFAGNKRTSHFFMNGILMSAGIDAISVPAAKREEFNEKMVQFYLKKDATEMMQFIAGCHPDAEII